MSRKLPVNNYELTDDTWWESDVGYFLEADVQYTEKLHELHNDLRLLPERIKIEEVEKLVTNLHDKTEYVIHIRNLKEALNQGLVLKKIRREFKSNQNAWLKPYIDMNTKLSLFQVHE